MAKVCNHSCTIFKSSSKSSLVSMNYRDFSWINFRLYYNFLCFALGINSCTLSHIYIIYIYYIYIYILYIYICIYKCLKIYRLNFIKIILKKLQKKLEKDRKKKTSHNILFKDTNLFERMDGKKLVEYRKKILKNEKNLFILTIKKTSFI